MKYLLVLLSVVLLSASCAQKVTYEELEEKYGKLESYEPKARFVHFKTEDGYQIDCLKFDNGYQFLSKNKIK